MTFTINRLLFLFVFCFGAVLAKNCSLEFDDIPTKVIRANVILEGVPETSFNGTKSNQVVPFRVRNVFKGKIRGKNQSGDLRRTLTVDVSLHNVSRAMRRCGAEVIEGQRYIVFIKDVSDRTSSSHMEADASSLPLLATKKTRRQVRRYSCPKCAQKPSVLLSPKEVLLNPTDKLKLSCKVRGKPQPEVTWFKDSKPLQSSSHIKIKRNKRGSLLRIKLPSIEDTGLYGCQATNVVGSSSLVTAHVKQVPSEAVAHAKLCDEHSYCLNGGVCYVMLLLENKFCLCKSDFEGERCQLKRRGHITVEPSPVIQVPSSTSSLVPTLVFSLSILSVILLLLFVVHLSCLNRSKCAHSRNNLNQSTQFCLVNVCCGTSNRNRSKSIIRKENGIEQSCHSDVETQTEVVVTRMTRNCHSWGGPFSQPLEQSYLYSPERTGARLSRIRLGAISGSD